MGRREGEGVEKRKQLRVAAGQRLRAAREARGLNAASAARLAGVSQASWRGWEVGVTFPLRRAWEVVGVDPDDECFSASELRDRLVVLFAGLRRGGMGLVDLADRVGMPLSTAYLYDRHGLLADAEPSEGLDAWLDVEKMIELRRRHGLGGGE